MALVAGKTTVAMHRRVGGRSGGKAPSSRRCGVAVGAGTASMVEMDRQPGAGAVTGNAIHGVGAMGGVGGWPAGTATSEVTAFAIPQHRHVVDPADVVPGQGGMAERTIVAGLDVRRTLDHRAGIGQQVVAGGALSWRTTKLPRGVAGIALNGTVAPGQWKAGGEVVEVVAVGCGGECQWQAKQ